MLNQIGSKAASQLTFDTDTVTIGPRGFTVRALASGTPCLRLFVTSICHWRLSDIN